LIFIITAFVLFILEIKATTHGALAAAGIASFITGSLVLFNSPGTPAFQRVSIPLVVGAGIFTAALFLVVLTFAIRAQRRPHAVGAEALLGRVGKVRETLKPSGTVLVGGELWSADAEDVDSAVEVGSSVEVIAVDGLRLTVKPHVTKRD
jgi:membrane-bound serine protease (ClpP class)